MKCHFVLCLLRFCSVLDILFCTTSASGLFYECEWNIWFLLLCDDIQVDFFVYCSHTVV